MSHIDPDEFIALMRPELERVAELALSRRAAAKPIRKDTLNDDDSIEHEPESESRVGALSEADLEIQEVLLKSVYENYPFISVLAEENTETRLKFQPGSEYCLLLDPIDGTKQYLSGGSAFCHTISLMKENRMLVSMIYSHTKNGLFVANSGRGVHLFPRACAPERIVLEPRRGNIFLCHVSRISSDLMNDLSAFGYDVKPSAQNATDILAMLDGHIVGFISLSPTVYDVWSPAAIIEESGGWLSDWHGMPLEFHNKARISHVLVSASENIAMRTIPLLKAYVPASSVERKN